MGKQEIKEKYLLLKEKDRTERIDALKQISQKNDKLFISLIKECGESNGHEFGENKLEQNILGYDYYHYCKYCGYREKSKQ